MSFKEELNIEINTDLNAAGFRRLRKELGKTQAQMSKSLGVLRQAQEFNKLRASARKLDEAMDEVGMTMGESGQFFMEGRQGALSQAEAVERLAQGLRQLKGAPDLDQSFGQIRSPADLMQTRFDPSQFQMPEFSGGMRPDTIDALPSIRGFDTDNLVGGAASASLDRLARQAGETSMRVTQYSQSVENASADTRMFDSVTDRLSAALERVQINALGAAGSLRAMTGSLASAAPAARKLQMRLLGLQFTMLTVAFIFGGLAMGALGAVGAFKVLGNTLRFFFLPSALNVLDLMLDFQSAVMGMDRSTREQIGNMFMLAAGFAVVVGILAALGKALLSVVGFFSTLGSVAGTIIQLLTGISTGTSGLISTLTALGGGSFFTGIKVALSLMAGTIATIVSFLTTFAAGFLIVTRAAKKFGKKVAAVIGVILIIIGAVVAAFLSIPVGIGLAIGAALGLLWTFKDTVFSIFAGLVNGIIGFIDWLITGMVKAFNWVVNTIVNILGWLVKKVVGNSIIPDMVKSIIDFIMSIPGKIVNLGSNIVDTIVNGIKNAGSAIWNAFKKILPDFLIDAIEGAGKAVKGIVDAGGNIVNSAGNVAGQAANKFSNLFGGSNKDKGGGTTKVQNNDINVNAEVNNSEETAQETGRQTGQAINNEVERKWGQKNP